MSWIKAIALLVLISLVLGFQEDGRGLIVKKTIRNEEISLRQGIESEMRIDLVD